MQRVRERNLVDNLPSCTMLSIRTFHQFASFGLGVMCTCDMTVFVGFRVVSRQIQMSNKMFSQQKFQFKIDERHLKIVTKLESYEKHCSNSAVGQDQRCLIMMIS